MSIYGEKGKNCPQSYPHKKTGISEGQTVIHEVIHIIHRLRCGKGTVRKTVYWNGCFGEFHEFYKKITKISQTGIDRKKELFSVKF